MQDYSYKTYLADAKNCYELQEYECAIIHTNEAEEFNPLGTGRHGGQRDRELR